MPDVAFCYVCESYYSTDTSELCCDGGRANDYDLRPRGRRRIPARCIRLWQVMYKSDPKSVGRLWAEVDGIADVRPRQG